MSLISDATVCEQMLRLATVPLQITLAPEDVTASAPPLPCFVCVPRASVLAAVWQHIVDTFTGSIADFGTPPPVWLTLDVAARSIVGAATLLEPQSGSSGSYTQQCLPWHMPVGAVVDSLAARGVSGAVELPLRLVAHMSPPPPKAHVWTLTRRKEVDILAQQCLKQGLMARFRELRPFYKAPPDDITCYVQGALSLQASESAKHARYAASVEAMLKNGRHLCAGDGAAPKLAIVVHRGETYGTVLLDTPVVAAPVRHDSFSGTVRSLGPTPTTPAPGLVHSATGGSELSATTSTVAVVQQAPALDHAAAGDTTVHAHSSTLTFAHAVARALRESERAVAGCNLGPSVSLDSPPADMFQHPTLRVLACGVELPLDTPLAWVMQHLVYADLALHLVVVARAGPRG
jgi:hypothetical protein